ncbi:hypothetical protein BU16DRAFT_466677 [Lophium mytilinum]|uniref:Uncharacterized protein n=1 Tax=Lophium mytilinum TaxID=390894 RepID=A0A6A6QLI5_9PEZI|nr:hypothetical protein BU16DRAFT_466677 [Lophium mytilinum]
MVDSSIARLNDSPYTVETVDLIRRLFIGKPGQLPTQRFRMTKVRQIFADIKENYEEEITGAGGVSNKDVIIYCDLSRYKEFDKKKDLWLDQTTKELVKYKEQQCKGSVADFFALAVTRNPETSEVVSDDDIPDEELYWDEKPTQIQLCPWFVDWVKSKEFKTASDVKKRTKIGRVVIKLVESKNFGLKQIDAFSLLDKVLLHEMTHGRSAWLAYKEGTRITGTADVSSPSIRFSHHPCTQQSLTSSSGSDTFSRRLRTACIRMDKCQETCAKRRRCHRRDRLEAQGSG